MEKGRQTERVSFHGKNGHTWRLRHSDLYRVTEIRMKKSQKNDNPPTLRTRSAMSSNILPPCITITLEAISSAL